MPDITAPGQLLTLAEAYIDECARLERVVNVAGFCRYAGITTAHFRELAERFPEVAGQLLDLFEDEALNSDMSPSLLTSYLKARLGYGEEKSDGALNVTFEHDIMKDGG